MSLSPTQERVAADLISAVQHVPIVHLTSAPAGNEGICNGKGATTILRALAEQLPSAAFVDVSSSSPAPIDNSPLRGFDAFIRACLVAWESHDILLVDDIDIAASPEKINSVRLSAAGESYGFYETAAEPTLAIKLLSSHAIAHSKKLIFKSVEDHFLRFIGQPFTVNFPAFSADDYAFFLKLWLPNEELGAGLADQIYTQYPQLSAADLRVTCVPGRSKVAGVAGIGDAQTPPTVLERLSERLAPSHGSVSLEKIDAIDMADMPGLGEVMSQIEKHVLLPFEHPELARQYHAEPKHGVLLYGPPGTGKTSIGRALAHRLKGKMFMVKEINLHRELLVTFAAAEANAPSVVFIDDMDAVMQRDMIQYGHQADIFRFLLSKLDGLASKAAAAKPVIVMMACNNLKMLPEALLRSGRIELWLKTELPKQKVREEILEHCSAKADGVALRGADFKAVAKAAADFTPADLKRVCADSRNLLAAGHLEKQLASGRGPTADGEGAEAAMSSSEDVTKCMLVAVQELKTMKANVEMLIAGMYS